MPLKELDAAPLTEADVLVSDPRGWLARLAEVNLRPHSSLLFVLPGGNTCT